MISLLPVSFSNNIQIKKSNISFCSLPKLNNDTFEYSYKDSEITDTENKIKMLIARMKYLETLINSFDEEFFLEDDHVYSFETAEFEKYITFKKYNQEYDKLDDQLEILGKYLRHLKEHPKTAFLYDPELSSEEKSEKLKNLKNLLKVSEVAKQYNISNSSITACINADLIMADETSKGTTLIDMDSAQNLDILRRIGSTILTTAELQSQYEFTRKELAQLFEERKLISCNETGYYLVVDLENETNLKTINEHVKVTPLKSKKHYKSYSEKYDNMVSVVYLSKLGFGTPQQLLKAIKEEKIPGRCSHIEYNGKKVIVAKVDISSMRTEYYLQNLRDSNPNIKSIRELSEAHNISVDEIKKAIIEDKLEIIPEFIFSSDSGEVFIDLSNEKNKEFVSQLTN